MVEIIKFKKYVLKYDKKRDGKLYKGLYYNIIISYIGLQFNIFMQQHFKEYIIRQCH